MSQFLPQEKIAEIHQASGIINIISEYVTLKNVGKNYVGLCPFHNEKTPSFTVNPEKKYYKCFGCGEAGTVFTFLMKLNGAKFIDIAKLLAEKANIDLPDGLNGRETKDENKVLYTINNHFTNYYNKVLMTNDSAKHVRKYLSDRSFNESTVKKFSIGYSFPSWDSSLREGAARMFKVDELEKTGIVLQKRKGSGHYDRFRGRLMFPIFSETGNVVGFGARTLDDSQVKYINSPESKIFNKRRILYGLNFAKDKIVKRNEAIVMEGYTDVVMAYQCGIDWAIGVMGTSLTYEHVKLLSRYCKRVVLVLDADEAGINSAEKSANLFIENGFDVIIVQLPEGCDPCEFFVSKGKEAFLHQLENGNNFFDFKLDIAKLRGELKTVSGKAKVFNEIIATAMKIPDILKQEVQIKEIAEKIKIDESRVRMQLKNLKDKTKKADFSKMEKRDRHDRTCLSDSRKLNASDLMEMNLIGLMISDNKFIPLVKCDIGLENFLNESLQCIVKATFDIFDNTGSVSSDELFSVLDTSTHQTLVDIMSAEQLFNSSANVFEGCKQYLNRRLSKFAIKKTKNQTMNFGNEKDSKVKSEEKEDLNELLDRFHKENKRLQSFKGDQKKMGGLKRRPNTFA